MRLIILWKTDSMTCYGIQNNLYHHPGRGFDTAAVFVIG